MLQQRGSYCNVKEERKVHEDLDKLPTQGTERACDLQITRPMLYQPSCNDGNLPVYFMRL